MIQVSIISATETRLADIVPLGGYAPPSDPSMPWLLPRHRDEAALVLRLTQMPTRLADLGFSISTGPLVWNRRKERFRDRAGRGTVPVVWAEAITPDGRFTTDYQKRNRLAWFSPEPGRDDANLVAERVGLLQRTTAKEQPRRLVAAAVAKHFFARHPLFTVENHVNMIRSRPDNEIELETVVAILNAEVVDRAFRCVNGSVAVSAFELEKGLPMPDRHAVLAIQGLLRSGAALAEINAALNRLYGAGA